MDPKPAIRLPRPALPRTRNCVSIPLTCPTHGCDAGECYLPAFTRFFACPPTHPRKRPVGEVEPLCFVWVLRVCPPYPRNVLSTKLKVASRGQACMRFCAPTRSNDVPFAFTYRPSRSAQRSCPADPCQTPPPPPH